MNAQDKNTIDLVIVASRGLNAMNRMILGSTSDYLVNHCHFPLIVFKGDEAIVSPPIIEIPPVDDRPPVIKEMS